MYSNLDEYKTGNYGEDNYYEPQKVYDCDCCDNGIYEGEDFYEIEGMHICENCISKFKCIANFHEEESF